MLNDFIVHPACPKIHSLEFNKLDKYLSDIYTNIIIHTQSSTNKM